MRLADVDADFTELTMMAAKWPGFCIETSYFMTVKTVCTDPSKTQIAANDP